MTRIAVLADIHANIPALEAVLRDLKLHSPDEILLGGDLVGRGPQGSAVVKIAHDLRAPCVRGNHEDYMLAWRKRQVPEEWFLSQEWAAARWMASELDDSDIHYIDALPFSLTASSSSKIRLLHGSPFSNNEGIGAWSSEEDLQRYLAAIDEEILLCAHTHRPFLRSFGSRTIVNVGSVGLPFNGDPRAQYVLLTLGKDRIEVDFRQIAYPLDDTLQIYHDTGFSDHAGVTADLLRLEILHARPFLVPFLKWAEVSDQPPVSASIPRFLALYDPEASMAAFFQRLGLPPV